jgi:predicted nucleic acid-binding protein
MDTLTPKFVVVETSVWIDYFRGLRTPQTLWLLREIDRHRLVTLDVILCEVLQGIRLDAEFERVRQYLIQFELHDAVGDIGATASARNYGTLRARGITVRKTMDCIIASCCIRNGFYLLHNDRDFQPFAQHLGLRVVDTTEHTPPLQ